MNPDCVPGGVREGVGVQGRAAPGWYPDQSGRAPLRWWDGARWSSWASDGVRVWTTQEAPPRRVGPEDLSSLRFVEEVFLHEARRRGVLAEPQTRALVGLSRELAREAQDGSADGRRTEAAASRTAHGEAAPAVYPTTPAAPAVPAPAAYPTAPPATSAQPASSPSVPQPYPGAPYPGGTSGVPAGAVPTREPGRVARWWAGTRERFDADLTVHGLAYLGVLLLFVGVFGLVAFAFSDVTPALRPVAELAVAVVPFVAAGVLARSGARFVARTLVAVGALLLPVMVVTSTVDGFGFPPDLLGAALPLVTSLVSAALAVGYAAWTARRPSSGLGVMVAPVLWFAAGMAAVGLGRPVPRGEDVAVPGGAQVAVIALAVLLTTAVARRLLRVPALSVTVPAEAGRGDGAPVSWQRRLAASASAAAIPGVVVVGVLALVAGAAEGWPVLPVVVTAVALAATVALSGRFGPTTADVALLVGWAVVALRLLTAREGTVLVSPHVGWDGDLDAVRPWLLLGVVVLGVAVAEVVVRRMLSLSYAWSGTEGEDADPEAVQARAVAAWAGQVATRGVVVALVVWPLVVVLAAAVPGRAWWPVVGTAVVAAWAAWRRAAVTGTAAVVALDVAAAVAPGLTVLALWGPARGAVALLVGAGLVFAAVPLARGLHGRGAGDRFWVWWSACAGVLVLLGSVLELLIHVLEPTEPARAAVPLAAALVGTAFALRPWRARTTIAVVTPIAWWTWITAVLPLEVPAPVLSSGLAVVGLGVVAAAHMVGRRPGAARTARDLRAGRAMLGLAGHLTGVVALLLTLAHGWEFVAVLALGTVGWAITAVLGERAASPVAAAFERRGAGYAPWALVLAGVPVTVSAALDEFDVLPLDHAWSAAVLMGAALVYAVLTRVVRGGRLAVVLPWAAFTAAVLAPLGAATAWPLIAALTVLVVQVLVTRGRHTVMVWTAWAALTPVVGLTARTTSTAVRDLGGAAVLSATTIVVGGLLVVGALLADRARPSDPRLLPRRPVALAPAVLGALQLGLGIVVVAVVPDALTAGVLLAAAAVVVGAASALTGVGGVGAAAVLLAWVAAMPLLGRDHPGAWAHVATAAAMLAVAQGVAASGPPRTRWARWDVPLAVGAGIPAFTAVVTVAPADRPLLFTVVGALCVAAAVRLRRRAVLAEVLGWVGTLLVVLGAADTGPGWTALALAVLAAAHTALAAVRETGTMRTARQWIGALAAAAAWGTCVVAVGLGAQWATDVTAVVGALTVATVMGAAAAGVLGRSWLAPWGTVGVALALGGVLRVLPDPVVVAREWERASTWAAGNVVESIGSVAAGPSWWHVAAWLLLAVAAVLAVRAVPWGWWLEVGVVALLGGLLTAFSAGDVPRLGQVAVEVALSAAAAVALVLVARFARADGARAWRRPLTVLGIAATTLALGVALGATGAGPVRTMVAGVLAAAAVQCAATGVAWRVLGLRMAAPVVGWLAWALYAAQALGDVVVTWYTIPVGVALLAAAGVWRADRRDRGLDPADRGVAALELTGIAFLVVASFAAAFTQSVLHAFVAAGIGVLVAVWGLLTRVRRRFVAGIGIVLAGVVLAVALPLVALLPAWGAAGAWVLVAAVGVLAVVAATFLERGREAVRDGRARLLDATAGWE